MHLKVDWNVYINDKNKLKILIFKWNEGGERKNGQYTDPAPSGELGVNDLWRGGKEGKEEKGRRRKSKVMGGRGGVRHGLACRQHVSLNLAGIVLNRKYLFNSNLNLFDLKQNNHHFHYLSK